VVIATADVPKRRVEWRGAVRIIRSLFPPIDLFEDIADPQDWPLLISAEQKTNPRLMETIGNLDLIPAERRVSGPGATYLMAPFTHISPDRPSRFSDGTFGVLYAGSMFEVALFETMHHSARFMARTREPAGWVSQYREIVMDISADLHDIAGLPERAALLDANGYVESQRFAMALKMAGSEGIVYPSVRAGRGECVALFYPDLALHAMQGRHLDYHWDGVRIDLYRDPVSKQVFRVVPT
jgi:hypothetical protein